MKAQYEAQATVGPKLSNVLSPTAHLDTMKRGQMPALREVKFIKDSVESKMGFIFHRTDDAFDKSFFNVEGSVQPIIKTVKPGGSPRALASSRVTWCSRSTGSRG